MNKTKSWKPKENFLDSAPIFGPAVKTKTKQQIIIKVLITCVKKPKADKKTSEFKRKLAAMALVIRKGIEYYFYLNNEVSGE